MRCGEERASRDTINAPMPLFLSSLIFSLSPTQLHFTNRATSMLKLITQQKTHILSRSVYYISRSIHGVSGSPIRLRVGGFGWWDSEPLNIYHLGTLWSIMWVLTLCSNVVCLIPSPLYTLSLTSISLLSEIHILPPDPNWWRDEIKSIVCSQICDFVCPQWRLHGLLLFLFYNMHFLGLFIITKCFM